MNTEKSTTIETAEAKPDCAPATCCAAFFLGAAIIQGLDCAGADLKKGDWAGYAILFLIPLAISVTVAICQYRQHNDKLRHGG